MPDPLSIREIALAAVQTALAGLTAFALVRRNWSGQPGPGELPAAVLWDGGEETRANRTGAIQIALGCDVDIVCAVASDDELGPELSERLAQVKQLLMADWTLGGAVAEVRYLGCSEPVVDDEAGGSPLASLTARFELLIEHSEIDPYTERNG